MLGDLPRWRGGKAFDYFQALGKLVGGKTFLLEAGNRGGQIEARTAVEDHAGAHPFTQPLVGQADDGRPLDLWEEDEHLLDLAG